MGCLPSKEYYLRTLSFRRYNFCGPNIKLADRLNPDRTPQEWSKPINKIDEICIRHDIGYRNGSKREADETMFHELKGLRNRDLTWSELFAKYFIICVVGLIYRLRLSFVK
jgi:hypothetical protein